MKVVVELLQKAWDSNLITVAAMVIVVISLYAINIFFGTIIGTKENGFDLRKFLFGILKALGCGVGIFAFCYILNLFSLTMNQTDLVSINETVITTVEVIGVMYLWALDLAKEVLEKIKSWRDLKYVSYDSIDITKINDYDVDQNMKG